MSVRKRKWTTAAGEHKEAWVVDYVDAAGVRRLATFKRKKEADDHAAKFNVEVRDGIHVPDAQSATVKEAAEVWMKAVANGRNGRAPAEASTLRQYRQHVDIHIVPELGAVKLSKLTGPRVGDFRDHLLATLSRALAKKVLTSFKSIVREAQSRGLVVANVAASVSIQAKKETRHGEQVEIPEMDEIRAVLAKLDDLATQKNKQHAKAWRRYRALIATAIHTGFRASELRGLPWSSVDLKANTITVSQRADEDGKIGPPKSNTSRRTINVPASLVKLLREWKLECPSRELVFPNWQGQVEALANIHTRGWKPVQLAAGLAVPRSDKVDGEGEPVMEAKYTFHALRHFHASYMIADGANPKEVQSELGHATITLTYDLYGHLFRDDAAEQQRRERAERLASALA